MSSQWNQIAALAWKETRDNAWLLLTGFGVFLGLPLLQAGQARYGVRQRFEFEASLWVFLLGGLLAVLVGVAAAGRDVGGPVADFWRSRPVGVGRWMLVKFVVGLLVVIASCAVPLAVELATSHGSHYDWRFVGGFLAWGPFLWAALYGMGFLSGCLVRRPAHATLLGLAAMAVAYLAPVVLPPLQAVSVPWVIEHSHAGQRSGDPGTAAVRLSTVTLHPQHAAFVLAAAGLAVAAFLVGLAAVRRQWELQSGRRMLVGLAGSALFALFATAALQHGSNLPVLQEQSLDAGEGVLGIRAECTRGLIATTRDEYGRMLAALRTFEVTPAGVALGRPVSVIGLGRVQTSYGDAMRSVAWSADRPDVAYLIESYWPAPGRTVGSLLAVRLDGGGAGGRAATPLARVPLWDVTQKASEWWPPSDGSALYMAGDRLYAWADADARWRAVDVRSPAEPKVIDSPPPASSPSDVPAAGRTVAGANGTTVMALAAVPGAPPADRVRMSVRGYAWQVVDGDTVYRLTYERGVLTIARVTEVYDRWARVVDVGRYEPSMLAAFFGGSPESMGAAGGRVYLTSDSNWSHGPERMSRVTVVDARDPARPRATGHFAIPSKWPLVVHPLPDGRAVVGGDKVYLLGPPPG
jgi:hypothetical protein